MAVSQSATKHNRTIGCICQNFHCPQGAASGTFVGLFAPRTNELSDQLGELDGKKVFCDDGVCDTPGLKKRGKPLMETLMGLHIGDIAPNFTSDTSTGKITFHDWIGTDWVFFFSHPGDFTPVCTTEIGRTAQLSDEFAKRNVKPLGLSTDGVDEHLKWIDDVNDTQHTTVTFPIIADPDGTVAKLYDMIHDGQSSTQAVRSVFIVDPEKKIRLTLTYPMNVGRNFDEILRVIDALQLADAKRIATPADWKEGEQVIIPLSLDTAAAQVQFPQGWQEIRPYLRMTKV